MISRSIDGERPRAIHYEVQDVLEYVSRDAPTIARHPWHPGLDVLLDMDTREPIGWRIYGWSKVAPPAENGADVRSPEGASASLPPDTPNTSPHPSSGWRPSREEIARIAQKWIYRTAHQGPDHLCNGIADDVLALSPQEPAP